MEIYADVVLMVNFFMNSFILWAVAKLCRQKIKYLRLMAGGFLMALLYLFIMIVLPFNRIFSAGASVLILAAGILPALRPSSLKVFLRQIFLGYLCSFTLGGLGMMLFFNTSGHGATRVPWTFLIVCTTGAYVIIKLSLYLLESITLNKQMLCPVTIFVGDKNLSLQVLVDTGHSLHDPLNNAPVIIAEFESVKSLLPDNMRLLFYEEQENNLTNLLTVATGNRFYERIRMIPFVSLGLSNGMLVGFRPDRVSLSTASREHIREDVVIGIYNRKLSGDGRYQGLIGPELVA